MDQIRFSNVSNIQNTNLNFRSSQKNEISEKSHQKTESKGISQEAAGAMRAQALYSATQKTTDYLNEQMSKKEIITALKDKEELGRSFFGNKRPIANTITKAEDKTLAIKNFNILLNADDGKLSASEINTILSVATYINDGKAKEKEMERFGFEGGELTEENIRSISKTLEEDKALIQAINAQQRDMRNQARHLRMLDEQMRMEQQMMFDQQQQQMNMINQMSPMGFGF